MGNCYCRPVNCGQVLKYYHALVKEAEELFEKSENLVDKQAVGSIINALKTIKYSLDLAAKGIKLEIKASEMLEKSGCDCYCNSKSPQCEALLAEMTEEFKLEETLVIEAMEALEAALLALRHSIEARNRGYVLYEKYLNCVHANKPCPPHPAPPCPPHPVPPPRPHCCERPMPHYR